MKVKDVMTSEVAVIHTNNTLQEAADRMKALNVGGLFVYLDKEAVGFITDRDIVVRAVAQGMDSQKATVVDAMTEGLMTCTEQDDISEVIQVMATNEVRRLAVADDKQQLVGIVSLTDLAVKVDDQLAKEVMTILKKNTS